MTVGEGLAPPEKSCISIETLCRIANDIGYLTANFTYVFAKCRIRAKKSHIIPFVKLHKNAQGIYTKFYQRNFEKGLYSASECCIINLARERVLQLYAVMSEVAAMPVIQTEYVQ